MRTAPETVTFSASPLLIGEGIARKLRAIDIRRTGPHGIVYLPVHIPVQQARTASVAVDDRAFVPLSLLLSGTPEEDHQRGPERQAREIGRASCRERVGKDV